MLVFDRELELKVEALCALCDSVLSRRDARASLFDRLIDCLFELGGMRRPRARGRQAPDRQPWRGVRFVLPSARDVRCGRLRGGSAIPIPRGMLEDDVFPFV